jgi:hypothetical protein
MSAVPSHLVEDAGEEIDPADNEAESEPPERPEPEPAAIVPRLKEQSSRILANWVVRTANLPEFRATPGIELRRLEDRVPAVLDAVFTALASSGRSVDPVLIGEATRLAREHGQARAAEQFEAGVVLAEYQQLRDEVWRALWRLVDAEPQLSAAPRRLQARLDLLFDSLSIHAIEGWVDVRFSRGPSSLTVQLN